MNNINIKTKKIEMIFVFGILLIILFNSVSAAYSESKTTLQSLGTSDTSNEGYCLESDNDFLLQLASFGCTPSVVRSDLLEEQNVPVYCQLAATQINPLIDVEAISSMSFKGNYSKEISGISFYPAKAALSTKSKLNSAMLSNAGYVVITLKKQKNESTMPEYVQGNLTATIKYDIKSALGIGTASFHLPALTDEQWEAKYPYYSFWDAKGYVRADDVTTDEATISVYDKNLKKIDRVTLKKEKLPKA